MPKDEPGFEQLLAAFSAPPRESLLKGEDAEREAAFRTMVNGAVSGPHGRRDRGPSNLPTTVSIAEVTKGSR